MIETVVVVALGRDLFEQMQCQAAGRECTFSEGLAFSQVQRKEGRREQVTGPENLGRLSLCYRCDNVSLIRRPSPIRSQERQTDGISLARPAERWVSKNLLQRSQVDADFWHGLFDTQAGLVVGSPACRNNGRILLVNPNQWYFNKLVKIPCHKTPYRCSHRLNLSSQSSRSCARPNIKVLKDKDLEFANSIRPFFETASCSHNAFGQH
jgi:hypothetical protein